MTDSIYISGKELEKLLDEVKKIPVSISFEEMSNVMIGKKVSSIDSNLTSFSLELKITLETGEQICLTTDSVHNLTYAST